MSSQTVNLLFIKLVQCLSPKNTKSMLQKINYSYLELMNVNKSHFKILFLFFPSLLFTFSFLQTYSDQFYLATGRRIFHWLSLSVSSHLCHFTAYLVFPCWVCFAVECVCSWRRVRPGGSSAPLSDQMKLWWIFFLLGIIPSGTAGQLSASLQ